MIKPASRIKLIIKLSTYSAELELRMEEMLRGMLIYFWVLNKVMRFARMEEQKVREIVDTFHLDVEVPTERRIVSYLVSLSRYNRHTLLYWCIYLF